MHTRHIALQRLQYPTATIHLRLASIVWGGKQAHATSTFARMVAELYLSGFLARK
jgi:hypothetical protein